MIQLKVFGKKGSSSDTVRDIVCRGHENRQPK